MKILVTGSNGFVGKNLITHLKENDKWVVLPVDVDTCEKDFIKYTKECDFVFHLAGVNRPKEVSEFNVGNVDFTQKLISSLEKHKNFAPIAFSSSTQAELENDYGKSKQAAENLISEYGKKYKVPVYIFRFPNIFGKWCKPNYNSFVTTMCHNFANGLPVNIDDKTKELNLIYVDDVVNKLVDCLGGKREDDKDVFHKISLGEVEKLLTEFVVSRKAGGLILPSQKLGSFEKKLYAVYTSYLPQNEFIYGLKTHSDQRGSFTEFYKTLDFGQISVNVTKPGITKGNHYHHTKTEKFLVVSGKAIIRFKNIDTNEVVEYSVSGDNLQVVDIPVGWTHNIQNVGDTDLVTVMWASELFDKDKPDTVAMEI